MMISTLDISGVTDRVVDYAWALLVPRLHEGSFAVEDSAFLAGLALASIGRGKIETRQQALARLIHDTEQAVAGAGVFDAAVRG